MRRIFFIMGDIERERERERERKQLDFFGLLVANLILTDG